jgi:5-methylcytosine-specific restriction endonuclease McrA
VGKYFYKEQFPGSESFHFNLYAINEDGHEILMTKDHIQPTAKGGKNIVANLQTMCCNDNRDKGSTYDG